MEDIRLKTAPLEFAGKTWQLRCNMNVLADVQAAVGGDFSRAMNQNSTFRGSLEFLAAMLNDFADEQGWPERYTSRDLGRVIGWEEYSRLSETVMDLVYSSLSSAEPSEEETEPKN